MMRVKNGILSQIFIIAIVAMSMFSLVNAAVLNIYLQCLKYIVFPIFALGVPFFNMIRIRITVIKDVAFTILIFIVVLISTFFSKDYDYINIISFVLFPIAIIYFYSFPWSVDLLKKVLYEFIIIGFILFLAVFNAFGTSYNSSIYAMNPNAVGKLFLYVMLFVNVLGIEFKLSKIIIFVMNLACMYTVILFRARTSIGAMICFIIFFYFIPKKIKISRLFLVGVFLLLTIAGTVIPFIYVRMYYAGMELAAFEANGVLYAEGKSFYTGRETIWMTAISQFKDNTSAWLFGLGPSKLYSKHEGVVGRDAHSVYFTILTSYGLLSLISYIYFIFDKIRRVIWKQDERTVNYIICWFALMIHGFMETTWVFSEVFLPLNAMLLGIPLREHCLIYKSKYSRQ